MKTRKIATLAIALLAVAIFATEAYSFLGGADPSRNMGNYRSFSFYADRPGNSTAIWMQPGAAPPNAWNEFWFDNSGNFNLPGGLGLPGPVSIGTTSPTTIDATGTKTPATSVGWTGYFADGAMRVSVRAFGATGNGTTDDTADIMAAYDKLVSLGGGTLYFPPGTYKLSSRGSVTYTSLGSLPTCIDISGSNIHLEGDNAVISVNISASTTPTVVFGLPNGSSNGNKITGFTFLNSGSIPSPGSSHLGPYAIVITGGSDNLIENNTFGGPNSGFNVDIYLNDNTSAWTTSRNVIRNNRFLTTNAGVLAAYNNDTQIINNIFEGPIGADIRWHDIYISVGTCNALVSGNTIHMSQLQGSAISTNGQGPNPDERDNIISNNIIIGSATSYLSGQNGIELTGNMKGCQIVSNIIRDVADYGITLNGSGAAGTSDITSDTIISGNLILGSGSSGIYILNGARDTITNNRVYNSETYHAGGRDIFLTCVGTGHFFSDSYITGNVVRNNNVTTDAIFLDSCTTGNTVIAGQSWDASGTIVPVKDTGVSNTVLVPGCSGTVTLSSGSATVTNNCIMGNRPVVCTDQTAAAAVKCAPSAGSLFVEGTVGDVISWAQQ